MTQQVKTHAASPDNLSLILEPTWWKERAASLHKPLHMCWAHAPHVLGTRPTCTGYPLLHVQGTRSYMCQAHAPHVQGTRSYMCQGTHPTCAGHTPLHANWVNKCSFKKVPDTSFQNDGVYQACQCSFVSQIFYVVSTLFLHTLYLRIVIWRMRGFMPNVR